MPRPSSPLRLVRLEDRTAPANLRITNLRLVDGNNNLISEVPVGEQVWVRAAWAADNVTAGQAGQTYRVRFDFGGAEFWSGTQTTQQGNSTWTWYKSTWLARPGDNTVTATIDGGEVVAETNETDNSQSITFTAADPVGPPTKFVWPLSSKPTQVWKVNNYTDVDPRAGQRADYTGGPFQYDGHDAFDIDLPDAAAMDAGVPVLAAAGGTVTQVVDGNYDREIGAPTGDGNNVRINHGAGWSTLYYHLAANSIPVKVGDAVTAGQMLGMAGSSGNSTQAHLHFTTFHDGATVETMYDPAAYFIDPPIYQGDAEPLVTSTGVTNYDFFANNDSRERPSEAAVFPTSASWDAWVYLTLTNRRVGSDIKVNWIRPDGTLAAANTIGSASPRGGYWGYNLGNATWKAHPGTWQVVVTMDGVEKSRAQFRVVTGTGEPEVRVRDAAGGLLVDERTSWIPYGNVAVGAAGPEKTFTVENHGAAPLAVSGLRLPAGFSLVGAFPTAVAAGGSATFTVRLDSAVPGKKFGVVRFTTNDADEGVYSFIVRGQVTGTPAAGAPLLVVPDPAAAYVQGGPAVPLYPAATLTDADHPAYDGGEIRVEVIQGGSPDDRLAVRHDGTDPGQVGVDGTTVSFGGVVVGTLAGGVGAVPLTVTFGAGSTPEAVQAVLRNVTYETVATRADTRPRFTRATVTDPAGLVAAEGVRVSAMIDPFNDAPVVTGTATMTPVLEDTANPAGMTVRSFTDAAVNDPDAFDPTGIALTGFTNGEGGTWHYSNDGGSTWRVFGAVSATSALLLRETDLVRFTPTPNANGTATLTYRAWDQTTGVYGSRINLTTTPAGGTTAFSTAAQTAELVVTPVNDLPAFTAGGNQTVFEDSGERTVSNWATGITNGPSNEAGQTRTFLVSADRPELFAAGPAVAANGTLTFTPAPNAVGTTTVTVRLQDSGGGADTTAAQMFAITITGINDAPSFTPGPGPTAFDDSGPVTLAGWATNILPGPADEAGQDVTFEPVSNSNPGLFAAAPAVAADGTLTFTPAEGMTGTAEVAFQLRDDGGIANGGVDVSAPTSVTFTVTVGNRAPVADPDAATTAVNRSVMIDVLENDSDANGDPLRIVAVTAPARGSARIAGNRVIYTPRGAWGGEDSFTYTVSDGRGKSAVGTVTVTVTDPVAPKVRALRLYYGPGLAVDLAGVSRAVLPWARVTRVEAAFTEPVAVDAADLALVGKRTGAVGVAGFSYDAARFTAAWDLAPAAGDDRFTLRLLGTGPTGIRDGAGNALGNVARTFGLLTGDVDGNGVVGAADVAAARKQAAKRGPFGDVSGDGLIDAADYEIITGRRGNRLR